MHRRQTGFSLVEIAIVMVIVGLLVGGILKGQEMITQAKIRNVIADLTGMLGVQTGDAAGSTSLGGFGGLMICTAGLPDKIAIAVDTHMDDGLIGSGTVRGQRQAGPNSDIDTAASPDYAETGNDIYILCRAL